MRKEKFLEKVLTARVYDVARETPLDYMPKVSKRFGNQVYLKREDLQPVFSFKCRGAFNKIYQELQDNPKLQGVITASAGNHAQGVALAAKRLGVKAVIVMPRTTPQIKVDAVRNLGGKVVLHGDNYDAASAHARELEAKRIDLAYVGLDGNIGCMVNGAGLAMATLDMIQVCGGSPANFLDAGGGADKEKVKEAFKLILRDSKVKAILVNIFGGIVRCDLIAEGVVAAAEELGLEVPLVVRLQGTNAEQGREILASSGLDITPAETLGEAGEKAVAAARAAG